MKLSRKKIRSGRDSKISGIALFVLLSSLMLISFALKEVLSLTSMQVDRVRYQYDQVQAIYLARSTQNLARFFLIYDYQMDSKMSKDNASDSKDDLWAQPIPFPVPIEAIMAAAGEVAEKAGVESKSGDAEASNKSLDEDIMKRCKEFFEDFPGDALSQVTDLAQRINLNDLDNKDTFGAMVELLQATEEIREVMEIRGLNAEILAREIRDYMDANDKEEETQSPEDSPYRAAQLEYGPKDYLYSNLDELKMIPSMDDEIFEYLEPFVSGVYIAARKKPAKINLNTVGKEVFQSLLKEVSSPEEISDKFFKDRSENKRIYSEKTFAKMLSDNLGLDSDKIRLPIVGATSDAFRIQTLARVNQVELTMETIVGRGIKKPLDPYATIRISP